MTRRSLLAFAFLVPLASPGCGMARRKADRDAARAIGTVTRDFRASPHRVAVASLEAMRAELAEADLAGDSEFAAFPGPKPPEGDPLPPDFPGLRVTYLRDGKPVQELMSLRACRFAGKARDGQRVELAVLASPDGAAVSAHVGEIGDPPFSRALLDRVADRLARPAHPPGSAEEAALFRDFFGGVATREAIPSLRRAGGR